jgi:hypothetical protein
VSFLSPQCPSTLFTIPLVTLKRNFFLNSIILQCPWTPPPPPPSFAQKHFLSKPLWCPFIITNHVLGGCKLRCTQNLVTLLQFLVLSKIDVTYYTIGNGLGMKMCNQWWFTSKCIEMLINFSKKMDSILNWNIFL